MMTNISSLPPAILIVDNLPSPYVILNEHLVKEVPHVVVHYENNIESALVRLKEEMPYDVVVTDLSLRGSVGREGVKIAAAAHDRDSKTEIILITRYASGGQNVADALEAGANQYLDKTLKNFDEILKTIVTERLIRASFHRNYGIDTQAHSDYLDAKRIYIDDLKQSASSIQKSLLEIDGVRADLEEASLDNKPLSSVVAKIKKIEHLTAEVLKIINGF